MINQARHLPPVGGNTAWLGICLAVAVLGVLIVFLLQNTGSVEVSFLWLHGSLPLAFALLIASDRRVALSSDYGDSF